MFFKRSSIICRTFGAHCLCICGYMKLSSHSATVRHMSVHARRAVHVHLPSPKTFNQIKTLREKDNEDSALKEFQICLNSSKFWRVGVKKNSHKIKKKKM